MHYLVADIGGTHARLALLDTVLDPDGPGLPPLVYSATLPSGEFSSFEALLATLPRHCPLAAACLAVAGPVKGGRAKITNLEWGLDARALSESLGAPVELINDVAAAALGLQTLAAWDELTTLQEGSADPFAPRALATLGTGLGMATLVPGSAGWDALPSEGGHIGFAPRDAFEDALLDKQRAIFGRVSAERLISGSAMAAVYVAVREMSDVEPMPEVEAAVAQDPWTAGATIGAYSDRCALCDATVARVVSMFGAVAGDLVLLTLATGGLFVAGGIPGKLLRYFQRPEFLAAFNDKGRHRAVVENTPVYVVTTPDLGFRGAALRAMMLAGGGR